MANPTPYDLQLQLLEVAKTRSHDLRVGLDHYTVCPMTLYAESLRKAIAFGPPFDDAKMLDRLFGQKPNTTTMLIRVAHSELEEAIFQMDPIERLEVNRKQEKARISFLAEELPPAPPKRDAPDHVTTRIFHSDLTPGTRSFKHVDASHLV